MNIDSPPFHKSASSLSKMINREHLNRRNSKKKGGMMMFYVLYYPTLENV
jgi:hypothetical protein